MSPQALTTIDTLLSGAVRRERGRFHIVDRDHLRTRLPALVQVAVFSKDVTERRDLQHFLLDLSAASGVVSRSIWRLYYHLAKQPKLTYCVPAFNLRVMTFDSARALFRAAIAAEAGAFVVEIARSEMEYTDQRPLEFSAVVCAAAVVEGWRGPLFLQGDHFQVRPKAFTNNPASEQLALKSLIHEALDAGFQNIDLDASTIVDLSQPTVAQQQAENIRQTAALAAEIRRHKEGRDPVSIGGEVGEVGKENTTSHELRAFLQGTADTLRQSAPDQPGLMKVSIQTGSRHGGVVLADGTPGSMSVDFETIITLSKVAREEFGLAGVVQHGASTLPVELYERFRTSGAVEIHLSTIFQSLVLDHPAFPQELKIAMRDYVTQNFEHDRDPDDSDAQFWYRLRKKAVGPFKRQLWAMPSEVRQEIMADLEGRFRLLLRKLGVENTLADIRHLYAE
jgi:hypothetical protein